MHELSIALSLLEAAEDEAARRGLTVAVIHVRLGPLAGVVEESLLSAFELARESTSLASARLAIEVVPLRVACPTCRQERPARSAQMLCCAECGTPTHDVVSGRELELYALETP